MKYTLNDLKKDGIKAGDNDVAIYANKLFADTGRHYLKLHRDWYVNERFYRGEHWVVYSKTTNKIQVVPIVQGEIRRTVNKIKAQVRGIKNFIKRNQPRWEVHPNDASPEAMEVALTKNKILQNIYREKNIKGKLTDVVINGLKYSAGFLEASVDAEDGTADIEFWCDDTFDIFIDPFASSLKNARYYFKAFKKPLTSVLNNKEYTISKGEITPDNKDGSSQYKELLEQEKYQDSATKSSKDLESVIVKELWIKWGEGRDTKVRVITVIGTQCVRVYNPNYKRYPLFPYSPEKDANSIYSNAWIKDLISLNKSLDKSTSQIEGYIQRMLAGKYLIKQGVEVSSITDKGAEKIYYKGSVPPVQQNLQPLPAAPFNHLANLERWIEELGGIREASLGRAPGSVQSGKGIEALQASDAATVSEPIENLENMLSEVAEFILEVISDHQIVSESVVEEGEDVKYIGNVEEAPEGATVIKPSKVKVEIVPEIAYSEETKIERLFMLLEAGVIDPQTVLEKLSISNISDILERVKVAKEQQMQEEMVKQRESHRTDGEGPQDTADYADQENMKMAAGQEVPMTPMSLWTPEHTQLHLAFIQSDSEAYRQNQQLFDAHIQNEEQYQNGAVPEAGPTQGMQDMGGKMSFNQ